MKYIVGKKLGMSTIYDPEKGARTLTLVECLPNTVSQLRTKETDGYTAVQVSYAISPKKNGKKEFRTKEAEAFEVGSEITVGIFAEGEEITLTGTSKGKGFQGVVKRHGFHGSDQTHGHKHDHRAPGSIGSSFPEHVVKGKRMGGRMGSDRCTVKGIKVEYLDAEKNLIGVTGAVPGSLGSIVSIRSID